MRRISVIPLAVALLGLLIPSVSPAANRSESRRKPSLITYMR